MRHVVQQVLGVELPTPIPRMSYAEAMRRYGSDKPDLRVALELVDVADLVQGLRLQGVRGARERSGGRVAALRVPGGGGLTRKEIDDYTAFVTRYGAKGLAYVKVNERRERPRRPAVADHQVPERCGAERHPTARGRGRRRPDLLRRRQRQGGQRCLGALRLKVGAGPAAGRRRAGGRCGSWISRCSNGTLRQALGGHASSVHSRRRTTIRRSWQPTLARHGARPTTWC